MNQGTRRALAGTAAILAGTAGAIAAERYAIRRARSVPDDSRDEPMAERPGQERRITSWDGTELAVNVVGPEDAPTLVFCHGFTMDMTSWHFQWKRFAESYRCVLFDARGHGRSGPGVDGDYTIDAVGRDLRRVLDEVAGEGPVVLIGHSMGGMGILSLAGQFPEEFSGRVLGVVLANTAAAEILKGILGNLGTRLGTILLPRARRRLLASPDRAYRVRAAALERAPDLAFLIARATNFGSDAPPSLVDYVVSLASTAPMEVWTDMLASMIDIDLGEAIGSVTVPALVVAGDVDRLTPPASALALKRQLPDARMLVFSGAGHCVMLERHEQFNRELERFLKDAVKQKPGRGTGRPARARA